MISQVSKTLMLETLVLGHRRSNQIKKKNFTKELEVITHCSSLPYEIFQVQSCPPAPPNLLRVREGGLLKAYFLYRILFFQGVSVMPPPFWMLNMEENLSLH